MTNPSTWEQAAQDAAGPATELAEMDRHGTADRRGWSPGRDVRAGWRVEAPDGYFVVQDAYGERRDESEPKPVGDEALGGSVLVSFYHPAGESGC